MKHTYLFSLAGLAFYEDGKYGDESPLLVKHNNEYIESDFWDRPTFIEAEELKLTLK